MEDSGLANTYEEIEEKIEALQNDDPSDVDVTTELITIYEYLQVIICKLDRARKGIM